MLLINLVASKLEFNSEKIKNVSREANEGDEIMGLDMHLKKGKKIPKISFDEYKKINNKVFEEDKETLEEYKDYIQECGEHIHWKSLLDDVVYWRKANQIHKWFVDNVKDGIDDCDYYEVSKEDIEKLLNLCKEVLDKTITKKGKVANGRTYKDGTWQNNYEDGLVIVNPDVAEELLPTQDGFFFGSTGYDEYYLEDLKHTVEEFEKILKEFDFENNYLVYTSSW